MAKMHCLRVLLHGFSDGLLLVQQHAAHLDLQMWKLFSITGQYRSDRVHAAERCMDGRYGANDMYQGPRHNTMYCIKETLPR